MVLTGLVDMVLARMGWQMATYRSTVNAVMVRMDALVDVSAAIVRTTQNVSPNIHGYADQTCPIYSVVFNIQSLTLPRLAALILCRGIETGVSSSYLRTSETDIPPILQLFECGYAWQKNLIHNDLMFNIQYFTLRRLMGFTVNFMVV